MSRCTNEQRKRTEATQSRLVPLPSRFPIGRCDESGFSLMPIELLQFAKLQCLEQRNSVAGRVFILNRRDPWRGLESNSRLASCLGRMVRPASIAWRVGRASSQTSHALFLFCWGSKKSMQWHGFHYLVPVRFRAEALRLHLYRFPTGDPQCGQSSFFEAGD